MSLSKKAVLREQPLNHMKGKQREKSWREEKGRRSGSAGWRREEIITFIM